MSPFGLIAAIASAGKARLAGSLMTRKAANGRPDLGGIGGGDMALHVDRCGPGLRPQRGLSGPGRDHLLDARQATPDDAAAPQRDIGDQLFVQRQTGQPAGVAGHDLGRDHDIAGFQFRIQSTGNAEADDAPDAGGVDHGQKRPQLLRIATAADDGHAGAGRNAGLLHQTSHNQHRPPVNSIARGNPVPRPQIHIPTPTTLLLVLLKFRYRASAQSGKNFA